MNRHTRNSRFPMSLIALAALGACSIEAAGASDTGGPAVGTEQRREPVAYIVREKSLIGNELHEAGARVMYDGLPSDNLEPTDAEGRRRAAEFKESDKERVAKMLEANKESGVGDPSQFAQAFARELVKQKAESDAKFDALMEQNKQSMALMGQMIAKLGSGAITAAPAPAAADQAAPADTASADLPKSTGDANTSVDPDAPEAPPVNGSNTPVKRGRNG